MVIHCNLGIFIDFSNQSELTHQNFRKSKVGLFSTNSSDNQSQ